MQYSQHLMTINGYWGPYLKRILTKVVVVTKIIEVVVVIADIVVVDVAAKTAEIMLRSSCYLLCSCHAILSNDYRNAMVDGLWHQMV